MRAIATLFAILIASASNAQTYNIKDYGAVADGKTINTNAIQKTIDLCASKGGGIVYVPSGQFITGTFSLKNNVNLHLETGAILKGSANIKDYKSYEKPTYGTNYYGIIFTENAENVSITGSGAIDGNDSAFFEFDKAKKIDSISTKYSRQQGNYRKVSTGIGDGPVVPIEPRPRQMVLFAQCKRVTLRDVSLLNATFWTLHFADCDAVLVDGIRLWSNLLVPNADGIDVTSSSNVTITNADIRTGDDAIAIVGYDHHFEIPGFKGIKKDCENIVISNCNLQSASSAIRIGFLDQNDVKNIQISNVNITNSTRGIGLFLRDRGSLENINISNVYVQTKLRTGDWWGNGEPIHISAIRGKEDVKLGKIRNVNFSNIICEGENGLLVYGTSESTIQNLSFKDITFKVVDSKLNDVAGGNIDLRGVLGEKNQIFKHDIPGLYAQYVDGLTIEDFKLEWPDSIPSYFTNAITVKDFKNLSLHQIKGTSSPSNSSLKSVALIDGTGIKTDLDKTELSKENVN
ncbi:polygalacturonase [Pedobacter sp. UYP30]|uniref:glycoside hydrolase family 28 protein n=1 Tax=Pedobacter sp. UYP30 TaxID=1756400 RepID=UPI0033983472